MSDEQTQATEDPATDDSANEESETAAKTTKTEAPAEPPSPEEQIKELFERLQRVSADYQNYQKRVQRDKAKWSQDSVRGLLSSLLPVLDNLDSAIAAFDGEVKDPDALKQGVVMIREGFTRQLSSFKLVRIQVEPGTLFDPDDHEAIMVQPDEDAERREVLFQARAGYRLGDTVLRPAQVGVRQPPS
ncbi:MAG: nucleotide exchange factor GrpE [Planctomycetes bacterium]|nr:nucleotide exchange factor GrpE [Planctomycetota bacterium]